jgi:cation transport regulator ChaB
MKGKIGGGWDGVKNNPSKRAQEIYKEAYNSAWS